MHGPSDLVETAVEPPLEERELAGHDPISMLFQGRTLVLGRVFDMALRWRSIVVGRSHTLVSRASWRTAGDIAGNGRIAGLELLEPRDEETTLVRFANSDLSLDLFLCEFVQIGGFILFILGRVSMTIVGLLIGSRLIAGCRRAIFIEVIVIDFFGIAALVWLHGARVAVVGSRLTAGYRGLTGVGTWFWWHLRTATL